MPQIAVYVSFEKIMNSIVASRRALTHNNESNYYIYIQFTILLKNYPGQDCVPISLKSP